MQEEVLRHANYEGPKRRPVIPSEHSGLSSLSDARLHLLDSLPMFLLPRNHEVDDECPGKAECDRCQHSQGIEYKFVATGVIAETDPEKLRDRRPYSSLRCLKQGQLQGPPEGNQPRSCSA